MTPNPKHLEILSEVTGFSDSHLRKNDSTFYVYDALKAMQILQNRIDELEKENQLLVSGGGKLLQEKVELEKENDLLKKRVSIWSTMALDKEVKVTEHQLRELKNPKNPE